MRAALSALLLFAGCSSRVSVPIDDHEDARVLASLFPEHLRSLSECRKPIGEPKTWVEIDDLELANLDQGQFVPVVERRERGRFTDDSDQIRYVVRIDNCQPSPAPPLRIEAVFSESSLTPGTPAVFRRPRPVMLREWR